MTAAQPNLTCEVDLESIIENFENARAADADVSLARYLPPAGHFSYQEVLTELIRIDLEHRFAQGESRRAEDYVREFPELSEHPECLEQVAFEEYRQRRLAGQSVSPDEFRQRLGIAADWPRDVLNGEALLKPANGHSSLPRARSRASAVGSVKVLYELFDESQGPAALSGTRERPIEYIPTPSLGRSSPRAQQLPALGTEFLGFHLVAELGQGAFGKVYLARQGELADRFVALKVSRDLVGESRSLAQMQHTNIVPIYSVHRAHPLQAVCMPYLGHVTLAEVLRGLRGRHSLPDSGRELVSTLAAGKSAMHLPSSNGTHPTASRPSSTAGQAVSQLGTEKPALDLPAAPGETSVTLQQLEHMTYAQAVVWVGARLADGLAHAHERGILHRDLKPANVLLTAEGQPMLLDFNLAQDVKHSPSNAYIGGTLQYMAPEHLEAFKGAVRRVDERSDVYSLGAILYELLTGKPFCTVPRGPVDKLLPQLLAERQKPLPPLQSSFEIAIPPGVEAIIRHCLEPDPDKRYSSARDLREDLERQLENRSLLHAPEPLAQRAAKWFKRNRWITSPAAVAATVAAMGLTVAAVWVVTDRVHTRAREQWLRDDAAATFANFRQQQRSRHLPALLTVNLERHDYLQRGLDAATELLEPYQVLQDEHWRERPAVRYLPKKDQENLERQVGELLRLMAQTAHSFRDDARARALLGRAADSGISDLQEMCLDARKNLVDGKYDDAVTTLQKVVDNDPTQASAHLLLGYCQCITGRHADAVRSYSAGIALDPDDYLIYVARGQVHAEMHDYDGALGDFDRGIELFRERDAAEFPIALRDAYIARALVHQFKRQYDQALADFDRAELAGPATTSLHFRRALLLTQMGQAAKATRELALGMKEEPSDELSYVVRAYTRFARPGANPMDFELALHDLDQALKLNESSRDALSNKASLLAEGIGPQERYLAAVATLGMAKSPLAAAVLMVAGDACNRERQKQAALVLDLQVRCYPDLARARSARGVVLARLGKRDAALADAHEALRRSKKERDPLILFQIGDIYALTHPNDGALSCRWLAAALLQGFGYDILGWDNDLDSVRGSREFRELLRAAHIVEQAAKK